ncbi:MAG: AAA family ATPase [Thermoleophilia bacterium]
MTPIETIQHEHGIVGREQELGLALAVLASGRHLLLEGPVGVGKTTVALAVCSHLNRETVRIDGDERYSEAKLSGWFDPPLVLARGYSDESFFAGPLLAAMRTGAVLFINELNRMPESVQNVLLPALDEGLLILPRIGAVTAAPGFQVIATQNPVEYIATGHLSEALRDRFEHVALAYQERTQEEAIVARVSASPDHELIANAVALTRATRHHSAFKKGASIRAAIAMVAIAAELKAAGLAPPVALRQAAGAALATRVDLRADLDSDLTVTLDELYAAIIDGGADPDASGPPEGEAKKVR